MGVSGHIRELANRIKDRISQRGVNYLDLNDLLNVAVCAMDEGDDIEWALKVTDYVKQCCRYGIQNRIDIIQLDALEWKTLKCEAPHKFESFLIYMEKNRRPRKRFYLPRRKTLKVVVDDLQDLEDGVIEFYGLSLPPRVGKSTLCIFFLAWVIGRHPESHNAMSGHSGILADRFYNDILKLTQNEEYTYKEIFPDVSLANKSGDKNELYFSEVESFATLTCRGIDGTWTGAVDVSSDGYLYVDDLVRDRTESLSLSRLEKRYQDYLNVLVDRKNDGSKELMVGTRWNVMDPLGRVESQYKNNPRYRFRKIPALNEKDESNFDYDYGVGFSTKYYREMREKLDQNEWMAKYMQRPFVREGLLFPEESLQTFNGVLPEGGLVRKISICDVAWGGGDSLSEPFAYAYEDGKVYIPDWIFNRGDKTVTRPIVIGKALRHKPHQIHFEADNGGHEYADKVDEELQKQGFKTNVSSKRADNQTSKMARIIQYAPDIKANFVFLDEKHRDDEYQAAWDELTTFTQNGENPHDDAPDVLSILAAFLSGGLYAKCEAVPRPY